MRDIKKGLLCVCCLSVADGTALQGMRSITYAFPSETVPIQHH